MWKQAVFALLMTCIRICALMAQDLSEAQLSSEPNITQQSSEPAEDANGTTTEPNITQPSQEPPPENNSNSTEPKKAEASIGESEKTAQKEPFHWTKAIPWAIAAIGAIVGVAGWLFALYKYRHRIPDLKQQEITKRDVGAQFEAKKELEKSQTFEERYKKALREEVSWIRMLGSPDIPNLPVHLLDTFVSLRISETWRSEERFDLRRQQSQQEKERDSTPEQIMKRAFADRRMLLIIGDPGSGKTTLLKYYAICCMSTERCKRLGFDKTTLPIYFPLRQIRSYDDGITSLPSNLVKWAKNHSLPNDEKWFDDQLSQRPTLVLLDGLDEIGDLELRRRVCEWIDNTAEGLDKAKFVVTSRWTGYRRGDRIELGFPHLRADVQDFSPGQQEDFLQKWFCAAFLEENRDDSVTRHEWEESQRELGHKRAQVVIDFLRQEKNKAVRQLAAVPMLLQIIAVIWKQREVLPKARAELYQAALKYLLDYRDRRRNLDPLLPADQALRVLRPMSLWMQEDLRKDEVDRSTLHRQMQRKIDKINDKLTAKEFCENLRDRAGLIADYGESAYIFRHKSFREYLAALELVDATKRDQRRLKELVKYFGDDWWEEPLRFYISEADDKLFDGFMDALFTSEVSKELDQKQQNLLQTMICEASEVKVDSLRKRLNDGRVHETKKRYILDCLKTINNQEARNAVKEFVASAGSSQAHSHAQAIASELLPELLPPQEAVRVRDVFVALPSTFRNTHEFNAEYILIRGGQYTYSATKETATVPDIYFAKYQVTNKRYRSFIRYLKGGAVELSRILPLDGFYEKVGSTVEGFREYLGNDPQVWPEKLSSEYDDNKRFNGQDQPVVGISWFAARAYCCWLSLLDTIGQEWESDKPAGLYRLPKESEWEWAASGGKREYPWGDRKPNDKLANYDSNVGTTTPVGRYPEGATPEGLMDMAGNVWEWMKNWYDKDKDARSLRGGSWYLYEAYLRCSYRLRYVPANRYPFVGFRVVRSQS